MSTDTTPLAWLDSSGREHPAADAADAPALATIVPAGITADPLHTAAVLHFGIVPTGEHDVAQIDRYTDPNVEHVAGRWGSLTAVVAGTWEAWGAEDPDVVHPLDGQSLHVSVDVSARALDLLTLPELVESVREWLTGLVPSDSARLLDYAVVTDAAWSEGARVVTGNSSGPNVWGGPSHWTDRIDHERRTRGQGG